jgi:acyl carrier protein
MRSDDFNMSSTVDLLPAWTSLRHVQLLGALEREFAVEFTAEEAPHLRSCLALLDAIAAKLGRSA